MPITSRAPRFVEMNARPATQAGMDLPASRKAVAFFIYFFRAQPIPSTKTK